MAKQTTHGQPGPDASRFVATIDQIEALTPTVKSFHLSLDPPAMNFRPGQWIDLYVNDREAGTRTVGGFTIVSAPADGEHGRIQLAIKRLDGGRSARYLHDRATVGEQFAIEGPSGGFHLPDDPGPSLLFVAGGIGINPLMSMVRHIHRDALPARATLVYSARAPSDFAFREELQSIESENPRLRTVFTVTQPGAEPWPGQIGRIDASLLREALGRGATKCYLCGPPGMPTALASTLAGLGVPGKSIRFEEW